MGLPSNPLQIVTTLARARLGTRTPLKVTHLLTYACNVECGFCTRIHVPAGAMDDSQVLSMMNAFADLGTRWWVFNGGEPTLVPALSTYLDRAVELGFHTTLVTNGTRLEARYDELQRLDLVICSLHGTEQEHDRVVGRQGSYQQALRGLRILAEAGVEVCLLSVINEQNRGLPEEMLALGESLGAGVAFQPIVATRLGGAHIDYRRNGVHLVRSMLSRVRSRRALMLQQQSWQRWQYGSIHQPACSMRVTSDISPTRLVHGSGAR